MDTIGRLGSSRGGRKAARGLIVTGGVSPNEAGRLGRNGAVMSEAVVADHGRITSAVHPVRRTHRAAAPPRRPLCASRRPRRPVADRLEDQPVDAARADRG